MAAAFLSDTWLVTIDAVSRIQADALHSLFPVTKKVGIRGLYYIFLGILTIITSITMLFNAPGPLILLSAVIGFIGTVIFTGAIIILNHFYLPRHLPQWAGPGRAVLIMLTLAFISYLALAGAYVYLMFR